MLITEKWDAWVNMNYFTMKMEIFLILRGDPECKFLQPDGSMVTVLTHEDPSSKSVKPTLCLSRGQVQSIVDELAKNGVRADQRRYQTEIDLLKDHLGDMKRLVFDVLSAKRDVEVKT